MSKELRLGTNDNIMRRVFNIGVNTAMTEEPADDGVVLMARCEAAQGRETEPAAMPPAFHFGRQQTAVHLLREGS